MAVPRHSAPAAPAATRAPLPAVGLALLGVVILGWGFNWPIMKIVLDELSPWQFRTYSVPVAALLLFAVAGAARLPLGIPRERWGAMILVGLLNTTGWHVFSAFGLSMLPSGRAVLVAYTMPVFAAVFGVFGLREPLTGRVAGALVLGMAGVGVLMSGDFESVGASALGILHMLGAAVTWAAGIVGLKRVNWGMPTVSVTAWQLLIGSVPIVLTAAALGEVRLVPLSAPAALSFAFVTVIAIPVCTYAFYRAVRMLPPNVPAIGTLLIPVIGVISGSVVLGEAVGWRELAAAACILGALSLTVFGRRGA
jgi:drug/metabolite transporter (DMT)-like permease